MIVLYVLRLLAALIVGLIIGLICARDDITKSSRDFGIIGLGAALISIIAVGIFDSVDIPWVGDPGRLPAQIISALGFLGTGMIWITADHRVEGVTSAAYLWLTAILGMLIGAGFSEPGAIGLMLIILVFLISPHLQVYVHKNKLTQIKNGDDKAV